MSEMYVQQVPSQEELAETYRGMTFEEFKQLNDQDIEVLLSVRSQEIHSVDTDAISEEEYDELFFRLIGEARILENFLRWRLHGIPDRSITRQELMQRFSDTIVHKLELNPSFGLAAAEKVAEMDSDEQDVLYGLYMYFFQAHDPFEYLQIDSFSLQDTLRFDMDTISSFEKGKILVKTHSEPMVGDVYILSDTYYEHWMLWMRAFVESVAYPQDS